MNYDDILSRFSGIKKTGHGHQALCPAHDDDNASLSLGIGVNGSTIIKCHAGCSVESILSCVNLSMSDLFPDEPVKKNKKIYTGKTVKETEYKYFKNGIYQYSSVRIDVPGEKKKFVIRRGKTNGFGDTKPCLYNCDLLSKAIVEEETIYIPEGEKCCDRLTQLGLTATTNPLGGGKWHDDYTNCLFTANVVILSDNDTTGFNHAIKVADAIYDTVKQVKIVSLPVHGEKEDIVDWLDDYGGTLEKLLEICDATKIYEKEKVIDTQPEYYYDKDRKEYLFQNRRCWLLLNEGQFKKNLINLGFSEKKFKGENLSQVDMKIIEIREHKDIDYSGCLAGYQKGYYERGEVRMLITDGPKIIYPVKGDFKMLYGIVEGLFVNDGDQEQINYFLSWLKIAYESLLSKNSRSGHALVMAGKKDCGKSLLQKIITEILGGRMAKPYKYMIGKTEFNGDLFAAEHLVISDESASTDIRSRKEFGEQIKQFAGEEEHRCRDLYRRALTLNPFWRLSMSLNDEPEDLQILPPLTEGVDDKLIILRAYKKPMPMPTSKNEDRKKFWNKIICELPAFLHFLTEYKIPEEIIGNRFGVREFHNRYITMELDMFTPENRLLDLVDRSLFDNTGFDLTNEYKLTAGELETRLLSDEKVKFEAQKLFKWNNACGTYLGRLAKKFSDRVELMRTSDKRIWMIRRKV